MFSFKGPSFQIFKLPTSVKGQIYQLPGAIQVSVPTLYILYLKKRPKENMDFAPLRRFFDRTDTHTHTGYETVQNVGYYHVYI